MSSITAKVIDLSNMERGEIELDEGVFGVPVRRDILARAVNWQRAKRRAGTHKVKQRGDVAGSTKKKFRQKGTGRARQGSGKGTQFRGGGTAFGPVLRDHSHDLPKKVRRLALKTALSAKQAEGRLIVLDAATLDQPKTKNLSAKLAVLGWSNVLIIDASTLDENFVRAARNIPHIDVLPSQGANVYDILRRDALVLTKGAVTTLEARLK